MRARNPVFWLPLALGAAAIGTISVVWAQSGGTYVLGEVAIGRGGGIAGAGNQQVRAALGQPAIGQASGTQFAVSGGLFPLEGGPSPTASVSPTGSPTASPSASPSASASASPTPTPFRNNLPNKRRTLFLSNDGPLN